MKILVVEPLDPEVLDWLAGRHGLRYAPTLADDPLQFRRALPSAHALIIPPSVALDELGVQMAPRLRAVGRVSAGAENIDVDACARRGIEVVRPLHGSARAEAEFVIGAMLQLLRRVPVVNVEGLLVGRELGNTTVGLIGLTSAARPLSDLLRAFGARVVGYDPALHASDAAWEQTGVEPLPLRALFEKCDALAVMLTYYPRYRGLLGQRYLSLAKPNQVIVSLSFSSLFDDAALAQAMLSGRVAAVWFDSLEPGTLDPDRPLAGIDALQVTPCVASTTRESRLRSAWAVATRIDELLSPQPSATVFDVRTSAPGDLADVADGPGPD
jgi:phosphoglycerate dehydrogenase-like enzyme